MTASSFPSPLKSPFATLEKSVKFQLRNFVKFQFPFEVSWLKIPICVSNQNENKNKQSRFHSQSNFNCNFQLEFSIFNLNFQVEDTCCQATNNPSKLKTTNYSNFQLESCIPKLAFSNWNFPSFLAPKVDSRLDGSFVEWSLNWGICFWVSE